MRHTLRVPLLFYLFIYFFFGCLFFLSTNLLDFPLKILGSKLVFQVSRVFVFLPKKLLESPRTLDKIINNRCLMWRAFNWAVSMTSKMDSVSGFRNLQPYSLIQDF